MYRSALIWMEEWMTALDNASRYRNGNNINSKEQIIELIQPMFDKMENPKCEYDRTFLRMFQGTLKKCKTFYDTYKQGDENIIKLMWENFRIFYNEIEPKVKKMESIHLNKVSEELSNKKSFSLSIPGTYDAEITSPQLQYIDPILHVLNSQQHPRCVYMIDNEGIKWKFLLKGKEDLRVDQRIMQSFDLINSLLKTNRNTVDLNVTILKYAIVPFAPNAGLISWVTGADTFQQLVYEYRNNRDIRQSIELDIASQYFVTTNINSMSAMQRYEMFDLIASKTKANELREMLWLRAINPNIWLERNHNFTISTALMSMAGYCIGLGDRHPSNIMIQRHTGKVVHIDFGDSFEVAMNRNGFPERVPFRMTRMIVNALDSGCVDGLFRRCCEDVLWVLRENQSSIIAQLEVFVHEPIFYGHETKNNKTAQKGILERVACKLSGTDQNDDGMECDVSEQVDRLIRKAMDPHEYVRHFIGWCPFW
ncbi:PIKK family atypical protein kinase [Histomonas meleagridis]|uniref:PIKK family atypical protein kinase n=1 Tax=Histomonas meleagridis TaxID=135588 RepID=UPI0035593E32|nr:PIKK family atypical protein kinase [Histomonas meleagridis]KAH0802409.1 PIKK family atypical protein kinase [Histomonas meleagridis]